ncbi:hypothetical protein M422DRAFT_246746 [Sphaerobolus stellatus SS14]|nr:hypothetical protein M422DRAFT_246746 [Sphaerobolus stellatus SS14]
MNVLRLRPLPRGHLALPRPSIPAPRLPPHLCIRAFTHHSPVYPPKAPFVPPSSLDVVVPAGILDVLPKPANPAFYSGNGEFYTALRRLEVAAQECGQALRRGHALPFPKALEKGLPPLSLQFTDCKQITSRLGTPITASQRRKLLVVVREIMYYERIATVTGTAHLLVPLQKLLEPFVMGSRSLRREEEGDQRDEFGRTYAVGRRKESSARAWLIATQIAREVEAAPKLDAAARSSSPRAEALKKFENTPVMVTEVVVNNIPLAEYFPNAIDRARVIRPLKVTGVLGKFNVFAIVRGGGITGQAEALSLAIAKSLVKQEPELENILTQSRLLIRDRRMVERKKTNRPKARKGYQWVKR